VDCGFLIFFTHFKTLLKQNLNIKTQYFSMGISDNFIAKHVVEPFSKKRAML
jgi:hypothetical protein